MPKRYCPANFSQKIHGFSAELVGIQTGFGTDIDKLILKIMWKRKEVYKAKPIL